MRRRGASVHLIVLTMGCAASKAPPKRDPVEELIEEVHPKLERLVVSGNPGLDANARAKVDAFAATTTKNGGWIRG